MTSIPSVIFGVVILAFLSEAAPAAAQTQTQEETPGGNCLACHRVLGDERLVAPTRTFAQDIHAARGFGCVDCHGGDATAPGLSGMDPAKGFLAKPSREEVPHFCGRCHSDADFMKRYNPSLRVDQEEEFATSVHGRRLAENDDPKVATCVSCHPAHQIRPPSDPLSSVHPLNVAETCASCHADSSYMAEYDIPTDQYAKYRNSIHWQMMSEQQDLSAPTCNDCHGNHGAAPPGVSWVGNVCGQCHSVMANLYAQSVHARMFALMGQPGCATCHNNHEIHAATDDLLGFGEGAVCRRCHTEGAGSGMLVASIRSLIDSLRTAYDAADSLVMKAELAGMEVSDATLQLQNVQTALVQARTSVHAFNVLAVETKVTEGLESARATQAHAADLLSEIRFRRLGLAISSVIILLLIAGLVLKIKELETKQTRGET